MTRLTVIEITQQLEPVTHDTFIDVPEPTTPAPAGEELRDDPARGSA